MYFQSSRAIKLEVCLRVVLHHPWPRSLRHRHHQRTYPSGLTRKAHSMDMSSNRCTNPRRWPPEEMRDRTNGSCLLTQSEAGALVRENWQPEWLLNAWDMTSHIDLQSVATVARRLEPLNAKCVFTGGSIVSLLLLDHPGLATVRETLGRGKDDYVMSHAIEDIITIVDGRDTLKDEIAEAKEVKGRKFAHTRGLT